MKRMVSGILVAGVMLTIVLVSGSQKRAESEPVAVVQSELKIAIEERNPWTHLSLANTSEVLHFAIVSDRTGGRRPGVFAKAIAQLNLLRPAFVISVGDLIDGYTENEKELTDQWQDLESQVRKLQMSFFYVAGNHDLANAFQERHWQQRFGRRYYHFVYRDVLFLMLNADDPPSGGGKIGPNQTAFARQVLANNSKVAWTIVVLHRPLWEEEEGRANGWAEVEKALMGRPYTVFVGHEHSYRKFVRHGMNYYQLATTGGSSKLRGIPHGEFDHLVWVTMTKDGPVLANLLLDGILPENLAWNASK
jgi:serine/threonine-protein phosphatase CPPED1